MAVPDKVASESRTHSRRRAVPLYEAGPGLGGSPISLRVWDIPGCTGDAGDNAGDEGHTAPGRRVGAGMLLVPALDSVPAAQPCTSEAGFVQQTRVGGQLSAQGIVMSSVNKVPSPRVEFSLASAHGGQR